MADVVLATASPLPRPDRDMPLLTTALEARGLDVDVVAWDAPYDWASARLVVCRSTWDYVDDQRHFLAWAEDVGAATRLVNPAAVIRWNAHKTYLADLVTVGVPVLPTAFLRAGAGVADQAEALAGFDGEVVVKPAVGAGARDTVLTPSGSADAADRLAQLVATQDVLVQAYEPAVADGEDSLVFLGGVLSHGVHKVPATGDFRVQDAYGGHAETYEPTYLQLQVAAAVLAAVPYDLAYARVDLVRAEEPVLMELEVIEPELFLRLEPAAANRLAGHLVELLGEQAA